MIGSLNPTNQHLLSITTTTTTISMCQFCNPGQAEAAPFEANMEDHRSYSFFSMAAIDEAIRVTSGGCTPICDHHRRVLFGGSLSNENNQESEGDHVHDSDCDCDEEEEEDGT